jgi:hypothetical protein
MARVELSPINALGGKQTRGLAAGDIGIKCPICDFEYVHVATATNKVSVDGHTSVWVGTGGLFVVEFNGECGHKFELCFGFHKGNTAFFCRFDDSQLKTRHP